MRVPGYTTFALLVVSAVSCGDNTGPASTMKPSAIFALQELRGAPLPTPSFAAPLSDITLADTLEFFDARSVVRHTLVIKYSNGGIQRFTTERPVVNRYGVLLIDFNCRPDTSCIAIYVPDHGVLNGGTLVFRTSDEKISRFYTRVGALIVLDN